MNLNEIPKLAQSAFSSLLKDDKSQLLSVLKERDALAQKYPLMAEMFWNDFCVEWNKIQANHFIKTNVLLDTGKTINLYPSIWLSEWNNHLSTSLDKFNLGSDFDFRKLPFENYLQELNSLKVILKTVFKNTEKDFETSNSIKNHLLNWSFTSNTPEVQKENITMNIFLLAQNEYFSDKKEKSKDFSRSLIYIFSSYYGKQTKNNELLFRNYKDGKLSEKELHAVKERDLAFRDEDSKYWRYWLSVIPEDNFKESLSDTFDIKTYGKATTESITLKVYKSNTYLLLDEELPQKTATTYQHKKIKI